LLGALLLASCGAALSVDISGAVYLPADAPAAPAPPRAGVRVCLNGNERATWTRPDGSFVLRNASAGVHLFGDNTVANVHVSTLCARSPNLAPLTRLLAATCAHFSAAPFVTQVRSEDNCDADALSRLCIPQKFESSRWQRLRYSPTQLLSLLKCSTHSLSATALAATLQASACSGGSWQPTASQ
jgi:hypothetical protein